MPLNSGHRESHQSEHKYLFLLPFSIPVTQSAGKRVTPGAESLLSGWVDVWNGVSAMSEDTPSKVLVRRPTKFQTDSRGKARIVRHDMPHALPGRYPLSI